MEPKVGDTCDLVGHHGKKTPVQIMNNANDIYTIRYLDNSGRPDGTCRASELVEREGSGVAKPHEEAIAITAHSQVETTETKGESPEPVPKETDVQMGGLDPASAQDDEGSTNEEPEDSDPKATADDSDTAKVDEGTDNSG